MYSETPLLGRRGLLDKPTTAMVWLDRSSSGMLMPLTRFRPIYLQHLLEPLHLARRQVAIAPRRLVQLQERDLHAAQLLHQHPEVFEHHANLILAAFVNLDFVPRVVAR